MKKTNKNKSTPHGIILRRFIKINFYFIQEVLITIQTISDMEEKCPKDVYKVRLLWISRPLFPFIILTYLKYPPILTWTTP